MLWDVDGTLIDTAGLTARSFDLAVGAALGRPPGRHCVPMSGKTDPSIALDIMEATGLDPEEARRRLPSVLDRLETELAASAESFQEKGTVLPGVESVLARLDGQASVYQSVLTGNTASNAAVKLRTFGLDRWLDLEIGAFGSDRHDRDDLVPVATERAERLRGRSFAPDEVWVVGDTPRDLACARAAGVRCLLVATGNVPMDEIADIGADRVLADLADTDEVCALLLSPS